MEIKMEKDTVLHYIKEYATSQPESLAVCELRRNVTYKEYWTDIQKMASVLLKEGIKQKDHVVIRCTQNIAYLTIFCALQYIGALAIPVEKTLSSERIGEIAREVDGKWVISDEEVEGFRFLDWKVMYKKMEYAEQAECMLPSEKERSMILFTTGTTGSSKGVIVLHRNDVAIAGNVIEGTHMRKGNVEIIPMPLNHAFGLRRYQSVIVNGGTVCLMDGMAFIGTLWKLMDKYRANSMALSPASLGMIFQLSGDRIAEYKNQLDYIQIGSAPLMEADKQRLIRLLPDTRLYNFYGSSEAGCSCILDFNSNDNKTGCIGRPTINSVVRFTDEKGNEVDRSKLSPETPAILSWGGSIVMEGYYNAPELTREAMDGGFVKTKDLAYLDEDGQCILVGRADDIVNYGGSKISPAEVEDCAKNYENIIDCAYSSIPDAITGELPVMLVIRKEGYEEGEFLDYLTERLENYKLPKEIYYVEELPKTFKGTLLRKQVKELIKTF